MSPRLLLSLLSLLAVPALAGTVVELNAEASRAAPNDLLRASVYVEASDGNPAELARRVNAEVAAALRLIKARPTVSAKSAGQHAYPVYGQNGKPNGWRMRSELLVESRDTAAVAELLGELQQQRLAVASVSQLPAPETRRQVEDETTRDALRAFGERAGLIAGSLGRTYRIKELQVQQNGGPPPVGMVMARAATFAAEAAPAPLEAGTTTITTTVSGRIELAD